MAYPSCLAYFATKLENFSTCWKQVRAVGTENAGPGLVTSYVLPPNTLPDVRTLCFHGHIATGSSSTTANRANEFVVAPKHSEVLIDQMVITSGGTTICQTPNGVGQLMKLLMDHSMSSSRTYSRQIAQNQVCTGVNEAANTVPANGTYDDKDFLITNFASFLGTVAPPVLPTRLMNEVRIDVRWAPASVLLSGGTTQPVAPSYTIGNPNNIAGASQNYLMVKCYDINDDMYMNMLAERLNHGPLELPFQYVYGTTGGINATYNQRLNLDVSSQSVDMVLGTFLPANYTQQAAAGSNNMGPYNRTSWYYSRNGSGLTSSQFNINNDNLGIPAGLTQVFSEALTEFGGAQETVGGWDQYLSSASAFAQDFFVHPLRLNLSTDPADRLQSGTNGRGTKVSIAWTTAGTAPTAPATVAAAGVIPQLWVLCTSTLQISPGKVVNVVY